MGCAEEKKYLDHLDDMNKEAAIAIAKVRKLEKKRLTS